MISKKNYVWEFTNKKRLNKKEFLDYVEKKVFRTIRKFGMLPKDKKITLKKSDDLNTNVLKFVLEKKFSVGFVVNKPNFSSDNLSEVAEDSFENIISGDFVGPKPNDGIARPLFFHSDKEVELYAALKGIKGKKRTPNNSVQSLFGKFLGKNPNLELNVVNALGQIS